MAFANGTIAGEVLSGVSIRRWHGPRKSGRALAKKQVEQLLVAQHTIGFPESEEGTSVTTTMTVRAKITLWPALTIPAPIWFQVSWCSNPSIRCSTRAKTAVKIANNTDLTMTGTISRDPSNRRPRPSACPIKITLARIRASTSAAP
jgi:hypothetical protein